MKNSSPIILFSLYLLIIVAGQGIAEQVKYTLAIASMCLAAFEAYSKRFDNVLLIMIATGIIGFEIRVLPGFANFRVEDLIGFTIVPAVLLLTDMPKKAEARENALTNLLLIFCLIIFSSIILGYLLGMAPFYPRDFTIVSLFFKYLLIALLAQRISWTPPRLNKFLVIFITAFTTAAGLSVLQAFGSGFALDLGKAYFVMESRFDQLGIGGRQTGTAPNPNMFANILLMGFSIILSSSFFVKRGKTILLSIAFLLLIATFSTGSRSKNIGLIVIMMVIIVNTWRGISFTQRTGVVFVMIPMLYYIYTNFFFLSDYMSDFIAVMQNPVGDVSFKNRWVVGFPRAISYFLKSPILGMGPAKGLIFGLGDSEYYYFISRYGAVGVIWLISFYSILLTTFYKLSKKSSASNRIAKIIGLAIFSHTLGMLVNNLGGPTINSTPVVTNLYFTMLAIAFAISAQYKFHSRKLRCLREQNAF